MIIITLILASRLGGRSGVVYIELGNLFLAIIITITIAIATTITTITTITALAKSADRGLVLPPRAMCGFGGPHRRPGELALPPLTLATQNDPWPSLSSSGPPRFWFPPWPPFWVLGSPRLPQITGVKSSYIVGKDRTKMYIVIWRVHGA